MSRIFFHYFLNLLFFSRETISFTKVHILKITELESLPTAGGRKLLISGWWGMVRHPNYLGEILIQWSWVLPAGTWSFHTFLIMIYISRSQISIETSFAIFGGPSPIHTDLKIKSNCNFKKIAIFCHMLEPIFLKIKIRGRSNE